MPQLTLPVPCWRLKLRSLVNHIQFLFGTKASASDRPVPCRD